MGSWEVLSGMRVLVCGDRHWTDQTLVETMLFGYNRDDELVLIEGCAPGADTCACAWGRDELPGDRHMHFPAAWDRYGRGAGPRRNEQMLVQGQPDIVLAFHNDLTQSKGTKDMIARAMGAGVHVFHVRRIGQ